MKNEYKIIGDKTILYVNHKNLVIEVLIDTSSLEKVNSIKGTWFATKRSFGKGVYIKTNLSSDKGKTRKNLLLHRFLMGEPTSDYYVDHIDRDTLNNTLSNLRLLTPSQSSQNISASSCSKTKIRGVSYDKTRNKWKATATIAGKSKTVGRFNNMEEAEKAVVLFRRKHMPYSYEGALK